MWKNVTRYATYNGDVSWSRTGNKIGFIAQRRGLYSPHVLSLHLERPPAGRAARHRVYPHERRTPHVAAEWTGQFVHAQAPEASMYHHAPPRVPLPHRSRHPTLGPCRPSHYDRTP